MRTVCLIRHGATAANERRLYYGATDLPVSENGRKELEKLREKGGYPDISGFAVYTSGMKRTAETLDILYPETKYSVEPELSEMNFGKFEMRAYEELQYDPEYQKWIEGDYLKNVCPDGESACQHAERAVRGFNRVINEVTGNILMICHGGTIASVMMSLFPNEGEDRWYWDCPNGCGYAVEFDGLKPISYKKLPFLQE